MDNLDKLQLMSINVEQILAELKSLRTEVKHLRLENEELREENKNLKLENAQLRSEIKVLQSKLNQDSQNSSKPPSSDPVWKRVSRPSISSDKKRKPGGQKGHKGHKLRKFEKVDHHVSHELNICPECGCGDLVVEGKVSRQVIDLPEPKVEVTEHEIWTYICSGCHSKVEGGKELGLKQEAQYGTRLKSLVSYLNVYQIVPYKRLTEFIKHLYGIQISQGTISNFNKELQSKLQPFKKATKSKLQNEVSILHSDETGCMVDKDLYWVHVYCTAFTTLLFGHKKRGKVAMEAIDILTQTKGTVIHDRFSSYLSYDTFDHGLCNAHILRELTAIKDDTQDNWPEKIQDLLLKAKKNKEQSGLTKRQITLYVNKYESILTAQRPHYQAVNTLLKRTTKRGKPKRTKDHNLYLALWKHRHAVFKYITDPDVPFDNNQAERDLRMLKIKMKVSNQFKDLEWLTAYLDIKSFLTTAIKQKRDVFDCILKTHQNPDFSTELAV